MRVSAEEELEQCAIDTGSTNDTYVATYFSLPKSTIEAFVERSQRIASKAFVQ